MSIYRRSVLRSGASVSAVGLAGLAGCLGDDQESNDDDGQESAGDDDQESSEDDQESSEDDQESVGVDDRESIGFNFTVPVENLGSLLDVPEIQDELDGLGDAYELDVTHDSATIDSLTAMAAGETDMALVTTDSYASAVSTEAVPGNITMIAFDFWDAHPDHYGFSVYSPPNSGIEEPEDLEDANLGINATGTGIHAIYVKQLQEVGLDPEADVDFVDLPFPAFMEALDDGIFDAGIFPALFAPGPRNEGFNEVFTSHDVFDEPYPFAYIVAANNSLEEKEDEIRAWLDDYVDVVEYIEDNRDEVVELASEHFELPHDIVDDFFLTENDYYRGEIEIDFDRLQDTMDELHNLGAVSQQFDVEEYATNEYLP